MHQDAPEPIAALASVGEQLVQIESLPTARLKLASLLEIYTPHHGGAEGAASIRRSMDAVVTEFEAAIREDEREQVKLRALKTLDDTAAVVAGQGQVDEPFTPPEGSLSFTPAEVESSEAEQPATPRGSRTRR